MHQRDIQTERTTVQQHRVNPFTMVAQQVKMLTYSNTVSENERTVQEFLSSSICFSDHKKTVCIVPRTSQGYSMKVIIISKELSVHDYCKYSCNTVLHLPSKLRN